MVRTLFLRAVFALSVTAWAVAAQGNPKPLPLPGIPSEFRYCYGVFQAENSWVAVSRDALLFDVGVTATPRLVRAPAGAELRTATAFGSRIIAAGKGPCYSYERGNWLKLDLSDHFWSAVPAFQGVLLTGAKGIYLIDRSLAPRKLREISSARPARAFLIGGLPYVFAGTDGVWSWNGLQLTDVTANFPWAAGNEVGSVQEIGDGRLLVATPRGIFYVNGTEIQPVLGDKLDLIRKQLLLDASQFGETLLVSTYYAGVSAYSVKTGELLWQIPPTSFNGNLYSSVCYKDGLVIGSSTGLFSIPDPARFQYYTVPPGDFRFVHQAGGQHQIGLSTGVFDLETGAKILPDSVLSLRQLKTGERAEGGFGRLKVGEKNVHLGGRDVQQIEELPNGDLVVLQPHGASLVTQSLDVTPLDLPAVPNSLGVTSTGEIFVGSPNGLFVLSPDGGHLRTLPGDHSRVFPDSGRVIVFTPEGHLYLDQQLLTTSLPFPEAVDAILFRNQVVVLARFANGSLHVGTVGSPAGSWNPLDIPVPAGALKLLSLRDKLSIVAPETLVCSDVLPTLQAPSLDSVRVYVGARQPPGPVIRLSSDEQSVSLSVPAPRLYPWLNPEYSVQLDAEPIAIAQAGSTLQIPRLPWGGSRVSVTARHAGLEARSNLEIHREWPLWARTPAFILYAVGLGLFGYCGVWVRTRSLQKRARHLQSMVDERTAELRQAQKAREEFFSTLSHEIRNPLNGVVGICEILEESSAQAIAPRERVFVRTLRGCADQLRSILDDVLDFARIDRGDIQIHEEPFELVSALEGAARAADAQLERCSLELPPAPIWVRGDVGKIRQIVTNLVSNALKYGVPPEARVKAFVEEDGPERLKIRIAVANTGNTIPADELERIFTGFVRGTDAVKRRIAGSGIGLAVSRRMARALGGDLTATSENGLTEFALGFTFERTAPEVELEPAILTEKTSRALAIEDEQYNRLVLGHILARMGYEVDWAADGATALERVRSGTYDLILTDFVLPDTNGVELTKTMLTLLKDPKPPIVAVTAYSTPDKMQQAKEAGISGFVTKPVSKKKLEAAILGVAPKVRIRQALDLDDSDLCNFNQLLRLPNGRQLLAQYAAELPDAWNGLVNALSEDPWGEKAAPLSRMVHAFKSRVLAAQAQSTAEQLGLLELAVKDDQRADAERLIRVIAPMIIDITEAARRKSVN